MQKAGHQVFPVKKEDEITVNHFSRKKISKYFDRGKIVFSGTTPGHSGPVCGTSPAALLFYFDDRSDTLV